MQEAIAKSGLKDYEELVNMVFDMLPEDSLEWIILGALRLKPAYTA